MNLGAWVLLVAVVVAATFGGWRALTDGRFRGTHRVRGSGGSGVSTGSTDDGGGSGVSTGSTAGGGGSGVSPGSTDGGGGSVVSTSSTDGGGGSTDSGGSAAGGVLPIGPLEALSVLGGTAYDARRGQRATLLQFSSAFCAPCRATRRTLADVAETVPGVTHVEVDAEEHLDLVRSLGVLRTPTTVVLDARGREVTRASGAPKPAQVLAALEASL